MAICSQVAATIVDVLIFSILIHSELWYVFALGISYFIGLSTNFWLSRRFVFGIYWKNWFVQYGVFATVALNSLLANLGLLQLLINELGWHPTLSRLVSALVSPQLVLPDINYIPSHPQINLIIKFPNCNLNYSSRPLQLENILMWQTRW